MSEIFQSNIAEWLKLEPLSEYGLYKTTFQTHHLGNVFIRSLHGGVTGATMEMVAEAVTRKQVASDTSLMITSNSTDYLRITKDVDLIARATIQRLSRRLCVVDVTCWQDEEDTLVARGVVSIKIG